MKLTAALAALLSLSLSFSTLAETLDLALRSGAPLIQVATWNDYGEGTVIKPTRAFGNRYLEQLQRVSKAVLSDVGVKLAQRAAVSAESPEQADEGDRLRTNVLYREGQDVTDPMRQSCRLDVYAPAKPGSFPTVIWFHGGGLTGGERCIPVPLRKQGVGIVAVDYRLAPAVKSPAFIEDAAAAVAWTFKHIGEFGGAPDRIYVSGHSAGAYLTLMVGLDPRWLRPHGIDPNRIAGLIPFSPQAITHFVIRGERGMSDKQPFVDDMAPLFHVRRDAPPTLILTGDREKELLGRYEENAYLWRMMKVVGHRDVELRELPGFNHGNMPEPAFPLLLEFIAKHERPSTLPK
jgi:acetyl esterase/lipase